MVLIIPGYNRGFALDQKSGKKNKMLNANQLKIIAQKEVEQEAGAGCEPMALVAAFPEAVMALSTEERQSVYAKVWTL